MRRGKRGKERRIEYGERTIRERRGEVCKEERERAGMKNEEEKREGQNKREIKVWLKFKVHSKIMVPLLLGELKAIRFLHMLAFGGFGGSV